MSYHIEKGTGDIIIDGWEQGISPSPHKGIANMQGVNISTEMKEVAVSYARVQQNQAGTTGPTFTIGIVDSSHLSTNAPLLNGSWITVGAGITGLSAGTYYIQNSNGTSTGSATSFQVSTYYNSSLISGFSGGGTATGNLFIAMGKPIASAIETYNAGFSSGTQYRYYILDSQGLVWVYDTNIVNSQAQGLLHWFLPDTSTTYFGSDTAPSGIGVLNGWLHVFSGNKIWVKSTINLGATGSTTSTYAQMTNAILMSTFDTLHPHFAFVGHQGKLYYTDGVYLGMIFPDTFLLTGLANIQSFANYGSTSTTGTIGTLYSGSIPSFGPNVGGPGFARVPAVFFTDAQGTIPSALTANTIYYIEYSTANGNFQVFAAFTGGSALDITSGKSGNQYFNTYYPIGTHAGAYGDTSTVTFTPERLNLPNFEVAQCMTEVGNNLIIGGIGNVLYPWNQVDPLPGSLIFLPENNTTNLITVNQMAYAFAGNKGNVYITDGSVASLVIKVPDYCAGIAGTESSYIEPYFTWGGAAYIRGRVYFSILDQTASKAGNCGGVWSFVPTQNLYIGQDTGLALRLENQNSYGSYNGVATVLLPSQTQNAISPQYWAGWYSNISGPTYGIDFTSTAPSTSAIVETDIITTGNLLEKQTFANLEYKLSAPLAAGDSIGLSYRLNATDAFTAMSINLESTTGLSGYVSPLPFENTQWLQLKITLNPTGNSSFCRLTELRLRVE
jgi:hypothetical protein